MTSWAKVLNSCVLCWPLHQMHARGEGWALLLLARYPRPILLLRLLPQKVQIQTQNKKCEHVLAILAMRAQPKAEHTAPKTELN